MALPTIVKTWTIAPNNRIAYVSLVDTMRNYLFGVKQFLKNTGGYTVKGSCNGTTGAMDGVDRWSTATDAGTRGAASGNAQSWFVFTDSNGVDILITFQGASDDIARISFSASSVFVAAGTPNQQPTATDEAIVLSGVTLIAANTSQDRIWFGWVSSDKKLCRFAIARNGVWVGQIWGIELVASSAIAGSVVVWSPTVWGLGVTPTNNLGAINVGVTRVVASSIGTTCSMRYGFEMIGNQTAPFTAKTELQGAKGYPVIPLAIGSFTTGAQGKFGSLIDMWIGRTSGGNPGDLYGAATHIGMDGYSTGSSGSGLWPWDGSTYPVLT